ncbi:MAG: hypothetical protein IJS60_02620 [Abditibacteriota bacterium]|nr:hypothetical protein [Abditibacteriota bacterium]
MKIKTLILALMVCIMAISVFAQNEKVSVKYNNVPASQAIEDLFRNYQKDFYYENGLNNGYVTLNLTDKPFDVVLTAILNQINATFEYKDGVYRIMPDPSKYSTGMGTAGRTGIGQPNIGVTPGTVGIGQPTLGTPTGAGVNPGMNPAGMGTARGTTGMGGTQGTLKPRSFEDPIMKIRINYNSPYQILSLMDGDDYTDVVWNNSGNSGSSNNNNNNNHNNNNNNSNSSSRSSRSSNR